MMLELCPHCGQIHKDFMECDEAASLSLSRESACSACCGAPMVVRGITTHWYECTNCGKPCDTQNHCSTDSSQDK